MHNQKYCEQNTITYLKPKLLNFISESQSHKKISRSILRRTSHTIAPSLSTYSPDMFDDKENDSTEELQPKRRDGKVSFDLRRNTIAPTLSTVSSDTFNDKEKNSTEFFKLIEGSGEKLSFHMVVFKKPLVTVSLRSKLVILCMRVRKIALSRKKMNIFSFLLITTTNIHSDNLTNILVSE